MSGRYKRIGNKSSVYFLSLLILSNVQGDWSPARDISQPGMNATAAKFATNGSGKSVAVWQKNEAHTVIQASIYSDGIWQDAVTLSDAEQNAYRPEVALNEKGEAIVVWQRFDKYNFVIQVSHYLDGCWTTPINLSEAGQNAFNPVVCINNKGKAYAAWRRFNGKHFLIQASFYNGSCWSTPQNLSAPLQNADSPEISCDDAGNATVIWQRSDGKNHIIQTSYFDGATWSEKPPSACIEDKSPPTEAPNQESESNTYSDSYSDSTPDQEVSLLPVNNRTSCCNYLTCTSSVIEARGAYMRPNSDRLRKIYGNAWFDFGLEGSYAFWKYFLAWIDAEYTFNYGETLGGNEPTDISIFPLSFGLKAALHYGCLQPYVGLGPKFFFVWVYNNSFILEQKENFSAVGGVAKFGTYFFPCDRIALSVFLDYSFARKTFSSCTCPGITRDDLDLSNLLIGASFGAYF